MALTVKIFFQPQTSGVTKSVLLCKEVLGFRGSCAKSDKLPQVMSLSQNWIVPHSYSKSLQATASSGLLL